MIGGLISVGEGRVDGRHCAVVKGLRFPVEIISHCVWLYHRFPLSFREVEKMMMERGSWSLMKRCGNGVPSSGRPTPTGSVAVGTAPATGGSGAGAMTTTDGRSRSLMFLRFHARLSHYGGHGRCCLVSSSRPSSEVGRQRGARGSGPFLSAPSRAVRAPFDAYRSPVFISGRWLRPVRRGCPGGIFRRPRGSCVYASPSDAPTMAVLVDLAC
jgi:hypothetical protein